MIFTDTHTHLYAEEFNPDRKEMIQRAIDQNVTRLFLPNIDTKSIQPMLDMVWAFPENCFPMMGLHPCSVDEHMEAHLFQVHKWFHKRQVPGRQTGFYGVGEIGLDYYWSIEFKEQQIHAFKTQIDWAIEFDLPVIIHSRDATDDCISILKEKNAPSLKGVFHCFSGRAEQAKEIISIGLYLGIGGVITYKNSGLDKSIADIGLEHLLLETDSPYLAPVPYRGKRNESAHIVEVAKKLAELKGISIEKVAEITTENSRILFGI